MIWSIWKGAQGVWIYTTVSPLQILHLTHSLFATDVTYYKSNLTLFCCNHLLMAAACIRDGLAQYAHAQVLAALVRIG